MPTEGLSFGSGSCLSAQYVTLKEAADDTASAC
jgi:hypothetical protein